MKKVLTTIAAIMCVLAMSMIFKEGTKKYTINLNQTESAAASTMSKVPNPVISKEKQLY